MSLCIEKMYKRFIYLDDIGEYNIGVTGSRGAHSAQHQPRPQLQGVQRGGVPFLVLMALTTTLIKATRPSPWCTSRRGAASYKQSSTTARTTIWYSDGGFPRHAVEQAHGAHHVRHAPCGPVGTVVGYLHGAARTPQRAAVLDGGAEIVVAFDFRGILAPEGCCSEAYDGHL